MHTFQVLLIFLLLSNISYFGGYCWKWNHGILLSWRAPCSFNKLSYICKALNVPYFTKMFFSCSSASPSMGSSQHCYSKVDTIESPGHAPLRLESNLKPGSPWLIHINPKNDDSESRNPTPTGFLSPTSLVNQSELAPKTKLSHFIGANEGRNSPQKPMCRTVSYDSNVLSQFMILVKPTKSEIYFIVSGFWHSDASDFLQILIKSYLLHSQGFHISCPCN